MTKSREIVLALVILLTALSSESREPAHDRGRVIDGATLRPIAGAFVTLGTAVVVTDGNGEFQLRGSGDTLGVRAYGHLRREVAVSALAKDAPIVLAPFTPKALYLSFFGIGNKQLRTAALSLIEETELNAVVIDVKADTGMVAFRSSVPLAARIGAQKVITINDLGSLLRDLHAKGIYAIARIVVFKDDRLASTRPDLAAKTAAGTIWKDRDGVAWSDPFNKSVWAYNIDIAVEAARAGFDEIQFDYVRFPDEPGLTYMERSTEQNRVAAITGFLAEARTRLVPHNVFLAADIFGYVPWNANDTHIGQKMENLGGVLDYISPMLYPSGFQFGIPGYVNPVQRPREVVHLTLQKAKERSGLPAIRFRPWLQAFRDYAFDKTAFRGEQIRMQIEAAESFGSNGWMLWNPRNIYRREGLQPER